MGAGEAGQVSSAFSGVARAGINPTKDEENQGTSDGMVPEKDKKPPMK